MLIPVQSFQKIIIGINQRNINLLTMRYTTDAMHQNKVIVSARYRPVSRRRERLKYRKLGMTGLKVYLNGTNLYTWSKIDNFDPETVNASGEVYPQQSVYNLGVNINF